MVEIFDITKGYGGRVLFSEAAFNVRPGEHIGLVGRNGHGKSTLLKILIGEETPDSGRVAVPNNYSLGYLRQIINLTERTVLEEACKGLPKDQKAEVWKAKKILMGLGFKDKDLSESPHIFSGGYQMRMELAKVLVSEPDMLLLDEPTNFLDIISIRWLESFLRNWRGELIVISHDRNFMDSVTTHIVGIHRGRVKKIKGPTQIYYDSVEKEEEVYERRRLNEEKDRKRIEEYISSFRAKARRAKSVQSSIKRLDKMGKLDKLGNIATLSFSFNAAPFRPPVMMEVRDIAFSYEGGLPRLIDGLSFIVERGDKICIAGPNGKGKTTLAKILAGIIRPIEGEIRMNPQVMMAYYEQGNTAALEDMKTVEEEIVAAHPGKNRTEARNICGAMMFSGDDGLKKISVLSGGERSRVLLAKTLLSPSNMLVLDEPTHHLDMESCSALFGAVEEYSGAAIVITHDEYFLHKVATKLIMFMEDRILVFPGNYSEFLDQIGWGDAEQGRKEKGKAETAKNKKEERRFRAEKRTKEKETLKPLERKIENIEKTITRLEKEHALTTENLIQSSEEGNAAAIPALSKRLNELGPEIDLLYEEMDAAVKAYEEAKNRG
ncbi:MAG: ATP-binding cassette domain-containing protein [Candidatus Omnitrophota bacterium]